MPAERVPVASARRQVERPAGGHAEQAPLGVEEIQEREEVVLVRPPAVEEDERSVDRLGPRVVPLATPRV